MAASTAGALKARVESAGLSLSAFRDVAPEGQAYPHVTVKEAVSVVREAEWNPLDDPTGHVSELAELNLWQQWRHPTTRVVTESYTLAEALFAWLNGCRLSASPSFTFLVTVESMVRLLEPKDNLVRHAFTVRIRRVL